MEKTLKVEVMHKALVVKTNAFPRTLDRLGREALLLKSHPITQHPRIQKFERTTKYCVVEDVVVMECLGNF